MQKIALFILIISLLLAGCAPTTPAEPAAALIVSGGSTEKSYTSEQLESLEVEQVTFNDIAFVGVPLSVLLTDAGFDLAQIKAVKAVASDGFSANFEAALFQKADTLVSYAQADGPLSADDGSFRMVLPGQEGKLNVRQLVEIQIIQ